MDKSVNKQIEELQNDFLYYSEIETVEGAEIALTAKRRADTLTLLRDTLISIATNQAGIASHTAKDALQKVGLCYHVNQIYKGGPGSNEAGGYWRCADCSEMSAERLEPFA